MIGEGHSSCYWMSSLLSSVVVVVVVFLGFVLAIPVSPGDSPGVIIVVIRGGGGGVFGVCVGHSCWPR